MLLQFFDLSIVPGPEPCQSILTLNSIPLDHPHHWASIDSWVQGVSDLNASGHELNVSWTSNCLVSVSPGPATHLFTLTVSSVDGEALVLPSLAGFTVSFKDDSDPKILRLSGPASKIEPLEVWADPSGYSKTHPSALKHETKKVLEDHIDDLRLLEAELEFLQSIISEKKKVIHSQFHTSIAGLKDEVRQCDGLICIIKAVFRKAHGAARAAYHKIRPNPYNGSILNQGMVWRPGQQAPAMIATQDEKTPSAFPLPPENCHCRDGKPSEKTPPNDNPSHGHVPESHFRDALPPSKLAILLKIFFTITGIAFVLALFRRRCLSPRKRRDRLARLEQRRAERAYRRSARRQAFWDWWHGRRRGNPGRRPGDYDEKRALVGQQECVLEGAMQDEISQLNIQEEIRQFRDTRNVVDELIRAEEGRVHPPAPPYPAFHRSSFPAHLQTPYPAGFTALPRAVPIPRPITPATPSSSSDVPFSPLSRTTSLPSYRSKPPSYREDEATDGFSDCALSIDPGTDDGGEDEGWSPGSSIPDLSPRPSAETTRTFLSGAETTRTFV